jgi:uncharacterized protein YjbI with pentapeptide repeats
MAQFSKLSEPARPPGFFNNNGNKTNGNTCTYEFDPREWESKHGITPELNDHEVNQDGNWSCEIPIHDGTSRCVFHLATDKKSNEEILVELNNLINKYNNSNRHCKILGANIQSLDIRDTKFDVENCSIDMRYSQFSSLCYIENSILPELNISGSVIEGEIGIKDSVINGNLDMESCRFEGADDGNLFLDDTEIIGDLVLSKSNIDGSVTLTDNEIKGKADLRHSSFHNGVDIFRTTIDGRSEFYRSNILGSIGGVRNDSLRLKSCEFNDMVHLQHIYLENAFNGDSSEYLGGLVFMHSSPGEFISLNRAVIESTLNFCGVDIPGSVLKLIESEVDEINVSNVTFTNDEQSQLEVRLEGARVESGDLYQSKGGKTYYYLERATIGEVNFKHQEERNLISPMINMIRHSEGDGTTPLFNLLSIHDTDYEGFDFEDYRVELEEVNWQLHNFAGGGSKREYELEFMEIDDSEGPDGPDWKDDNTNSIEIKGDFNNLEVLERTYLKAKNAAKASGDQLATSKFFIQEMNYRKVWYRKTALDKFIDSSDVNDLIRGYGHFSNWMIYSILEVISDYGEKIWPVLIYSSLLIIQSSLLLPLNGGISNNSTTISYQNINDGGIGLYEAFGQSLYFSTISFTTVGYGDYQPAKGIPQLIAGLESLMGALLIALIIFTLGRKVYK